MTEWRAARPHCGERDPFASESLARGTNLGRYELLAPIAVGGMARVWAAHLQGEHGFTKLVAIKTILPHLAHDPEFERMLVDEARIASGARHPNVVEIYDLGEERGVVYIAMEWVDGDSLSQILKPRGVPTRLDPRLAARIVADAAAGLHAAHDLTDADGGSLEVVHRDVSPHNLLVSLDGNVKVTDFGVAKAKGASHQATSAGQLKGKVAYMAPEHVTGASVDRRSDVFSLGCVLYEVTTGKQPFLGEGEHHVMQELIKGSFLRPSRVVGDYPNELERIVLRAMSPEPLHRYPTMDHMRLALEEWLAKRGAEVTPSNVAQVVRDRIGADVERRREKIRRATTVLRERGEAIDRLPPVPWETAVRSSRSFTPSGIESIAEHAPRIPSRTQNAAAASLGVIAAVALGASAFWVWTSMQPPQRVPLVAANLAPMEQAIPSSPSPTVDASATASIDVRPNEPTPAPKKRAGRHGGDGVSRRADPSESPEALPANPY